MWPGVCQSCVSTTFWKPRAILLMRGTISSPPLTARLPPGVKQFCTSTTTSAVSGPALILPWASARGTSADQRQRAGGGEERAARSIVHGEPPGDGDGGCPQLRAAAASPEVL